ncbi:1536_t:CDS:2 [Funneliformis caledonium]|uniref:1536_t:CDS:1 n=1 Tax=Funneliformis caledonium TaxID=1117310 RepID=A0A9N9GUU7_9GLOM|nr:1536_t:CDS:2 [Funneliformis caledonium]
MLNSTHDQKFIELWLEVTKPQSWSSIIYLLFWFPLWTIFCFAWILSTFMISIISLVIPPLGYFMCIGSVISLARVELITISFCTNPSRFLHDTVSEIASKKPLQPITKISPQSEFQGYIHFGVKYCYNQYTVDCLRYFLITKPIGMLFNIVMIPFFLVISLPPFALFGLPYTCKRCNMRGKSLCDGARSVLVPQWNAPRPSNQNQGNA